MTTSPFEKEIRYDRSTRDYAGYLDDRLIGFFGSHHAAEVELDRVARELSIDYCEQGLIDTLPIALLDPPPDDAPGEDCPDHGPYADDDCPKCGCGAATTLLVHCRGEHPYCEECYQREFEDNYEEYRGWEVEPLPMAFTAQSIQIEAKLSTCASCRGIHATYKCPELWTVLRLESWTGAELGRALCRLRWRNFAGFIDLLLSAAPTRVLEYAMSYQAFIRENNPASTLTINEVLTVWSREMRGERFNAALSQVDVRAA